MRLVPINVPPNFISQMRYCFSCRSTVPIIFGLFLPLWLGLTSRPVVVQAGENVNRHLSVFFNTYCSDCHYGPDGEAGLGLADFALDDVAEQADLLELVVRRMRSRQMPPMGSRRPSEAEYVEQLSRLTQLLDDYAKQHPNPGRTDTLRRMTRTEYQNAVRDLLHLRIDATEFLPRDESSHGFDNVTVGELSPTLLNRYISAAQRISRLAVGVERQAPGGYTKRVPPDVTQEQHVTGLPLGTRGGTQFLYNFPRTGEYEVEVRLARDRNEHVEGLHGKHQLQILLDGRQVQGFEVKPPADQDHSLVDAHLKFRLTVKAGPHDVGVTFVKKPSSLQETMRQPFDAHFNMHRHPRLSPAVYQVSINGPYKDVAAGDTPSRRKIFDCWPNSAEEEESTAKQIIKKLTRQAYRRPVTPEDIAKPLEFYRIERQRGRGFEHGIQAALSSILVSPHFLFRVEQDPAGAEPGDVYPLGDFELASRLSFFLWSSIPDESLLKLAERGELRQPDVLRAEVSRMLADERADSLVNNFAAQWLYLRNLDSITPDMRLFPDFDDNLRQAFRRETELLFESVMRNDHSVLELLSADYTFLNERLAEHYEIPHIYGSHFRRVELPEGSQRGGILRHGSVLTVTSYATRTSPVIRGHWILKNLVGAPPPPPPPDVPALEDNTVAANLPVRQRLAKHRENPACASCHDIMDPVGFALENFDAVGRWREMEAGVAVNAAGGLPDGSEFVGVAGLEAGLLRRPEWFVSTLAEKLLTFALGRGVEPSDAPAIREIVRSARQDDYRFSALITAIVDSDPFRLRTVK